MGMLLSYLSLWATKAREILAALETAKLHECNTVSKLITCDKCVKVSHFFFALSLFYTNPSLMTIFHHTFC